MQEKGGYQNIGHTHPWVRVHGTRTLQLSSTIYGIFTMHPCQPRLKTDARVRLFAGIPACAKRVFEYAISASFQKLAAAA